MTKDEIEIIKSVYDRFLLCDGDDYWSSLDEMMEYFEFLDDNEIINEASMRILLHRRDGIKCANDHNIEDCFAPTILDAVEAIVQLYDESKTLDNKNRYVLSYYMTLCELKLILYLNES